MMPTRQLLWTLLAVCTVGLPRGIDCRFIPNTQCITVTLDPCSHHPTLPSSVLCDNIGDLRTFIRVLRCGSKKNMNQVFLESSSIPSIPLIVMDFCGFFFLNMKEVSLTTLFEDPMDAPIRLQRLHLDAVTSSDPWTWSPLRALDKLERLSVARMPLPTVDAALVSHLSDGLQSLSLAATNTSRIAPGALARFADLVHVSVRDNLVERVERSMFANPARIKRFHFGSNRISSLPEDLFEGMPDLRSVDFQDNLIAEIHDVTFRGVWHSLSGLLLQGNPLKCHCKMLWLAKRFQPAVLTGECYSPKAIYGKPLKELSIQDFHC